MLQQLLQTTQAPAAVHVHIIPLLFMLLLVYGERCRSFCKEVCTQRLGGSGTSQPHCCRQEVSLEEPCRASEARFRIAMHACWYSRVTQLQCMVHLYLALPFLQELEGDWHSDGLSLGEFSI